MCRTFKTGGKTYRIEIGKAAEAFVGITGIGAWIYVIAVLEKAVLLG